MAGEVEISKLIQNMQPVLNSGEYVYCLASSKEQAAALDPINYFIEKEGLTMILPKEKADIFGIPYESVFAWITLTVHSSLEAVGLTAAVSKALAEENISCNMVAAFYHDHLFIPISDANRAQLVLQKLAGIT